MAIKGVVRQVKTPGDPDGTRWILADVEGVGPVEVAFPEDAAIDIAAEMQRGFLERTLEMIRPPQYPNGTVTNTFLAHGTDGRTALMVETPEYGTFAFIVPPEIIEKLRAELARLELTSTAKIKPN